MISGRIANGDAKQTAEPPLADDVATLKAMQLAERAVHRAELEKLKLTIAKLRHDQFGQSSERRALLEQLEMQLFELEEDQAEAETTAKIAAPQDVKVQSFEPQAGSPAVARSSAARTRRISGSLGLPLLRRRPAREQITQPPAPSHPIARGPARWRMFCSAITACICR